MGMYIGLSIFPPGGMESSPVMGGRQETDCSTLISVSGLFLSNCSSLGDRWHSKLKQNLFFLCSKTSEVLVPSSPYSSSPQMSSVINHPHCHLESMNPLNPWTVWSVGISMCILVQRESLAFIRFSKGVPPQKKSRTITVKYDIISLNV